MPEALTLALQLRAPMQSWAEGDRFADRASSALPTRSAVIGMLASALGRERQDDVSDLARLDFGVRADVLGENRRDFQTAFASAHLKKLRTHESLSWPYMREADLAHISVRSYLNDASFVVALRGEAPLVTELRDAMMSPARPLYLGRKSCPLTNWPLLGTFSDLELADQWAEQVQQGRPEVSSPLLAALYLTPLDARAGLCVFELDAWALSEAELPRYASFGTRLDMPTSSFADRRYGMREVWRWEQDLRSWHDARLGSAVNQGAFNQDQLELAQAEFEAPLSAATSLDVSWP